MEVLNTVRLNYKIMFICYILLALRASSRKVCLYDCNCCYAQNQIISDFFLL